MHSKQPVTVNLAQEKQTLLGDYNSMGTVSCPGMHTVHLWTKYKHKKGTKRP